MELEPDGVIGVEASRDLIQLPLSGAFQGGSQAGTVVAEPVQAAELANRLQSYLSQPT